MLVHDLPFGVDPYVDTKDKEIKQAVFSKKIMAVPPLTRRIITVRGKIDDLTLPERGMLFEPTNETVIFFAHMVDQQTKCVLAENDTPHTVTIEKDTEYTTEAINHLDDADVKMKQPDGSQDPIVLD